MSRSYARNGTTKRMCTHCYVCHMDKLMRVPYHRDLRHMLDKIDEEIERYEREKDEGITCRFDQAS